VIVVVAVVRSLFHYHLVMKHICVKKKRRQVIRIFMIFKMKFLLKEETKEEKKEGGTLKLP
jgi:hypothetical protein